jgi:uncharacterized membrane protein YczE
MILIVGTIIAAFGMCLLDIANQGQVTMAVLWDGMSRHFPISMGQACYVTSIVMILFSLVYDRSQVRIGTVVHFLLYGLATDAFARLIPRIGGSTVLMILYAAIGILLLGIGIGVYAFANLGRGPYEGLCFALCEKKHWQMKYVRAICDGFFIILGWFLGGAVGVVTVINIAFCGYLIQLTTSEMNRIFKGNKHSLLSVKQAVGRPISDQI